LSSGEKERGGEATERRSTLGKLADGRREFLAAMEEGRGQPLHEERKL